MRHAPRAFVLAMLAVSVRIAAPRETPFAPAVARADGADDARAAAIRDLMSPDDAVRAKAAGWLARQGRVGAEEVARHAELDDRALKAVAEAYVRAGWSGYAYDFVVAARTAPPAHAKRLLELAHALDPLAGVSRTREETAAEVHRLLVEAGRARCATGYCERIALLGHDAVEPLLDGMRDGDPEHPGGSIACGAVELLVEKEDLPAIRSLLIAGKVNLVRAVERLQREGVREATDALLDAAAAGLLDADVTRALARAPDRARVLEVVSEVVAARPEVAAKHRASLAALFQALDARESARVLASWIPTSTDPYDLVAIGDALVHFGDPKGVWVLVRIASERRTRFPCRPSTPAERAAASAPDRLCAEGFFSYDRERAARKLREIAGAEVFDLPDDVTRYLAAQPRPHESDDDYLDRAAAAYRAWWAASKDRIRFDAATGRWSVGR